MPILLFMTLCSEHKCLKITICKQLFFVLFTCHLLQIKKKIKSTFIFCCVERQVSISIFAHFCGKETYYQGYFWPSVNPNKGLRIFSLNPSSNLTTITTILKHVGKFNVKICRSREEEYIRHYTPNNEKITCQTFLL